MSSVDVKIKMVNLVVSNDSGLSISFDGQEFSNSVIISRENLIEKLKLIYPNNTSQWANGGLRPVSTNGIKTSNDSKFDMYYASSLEFMSDYSDERYLSLLKGSEDKISSGSYYIAFDLFFRNKTGSPISDNLYLDDETKITIDAGDSEEIRGLVNSLRIGIIKIGSVPLTASLDQIQNIQCNNECEAIIYEPNSTNHTDLSIKRALKYDIYLNNGTYYPTYAAINESSFCSLSDAVKGNNTDTFNLQITRFDFTKPLFQIPDGITKARAYIWIEGQDIDSLETYSKGADISITINFVKDTAGYDYYN